MPTLNIGDEPPAFAGFVGQGHTIRRSFEEGNVYLIDFWATVRALHRDHAAPDRAVPSMPMTV